MVPIDLIIDEAFVSRLLLGALSEHEQRLLVARLARSDSDFRTSLRSILEPFELLDHDLAREYSVALDLNPGDSDRLRRQILARSLTRVEDLEALLEEFTVNDALSLGAIAAGHRSGFQSQVADHAAEVAYTSGPSGD